MEKKVYLGRAENQKDPHSARPHEVMQQQQQQQPMINPQPQPMRRPPTAQRGPRGKQVLPRTINKPTRLADTVERPTPLQNEDPARNDVFAAFMSVREVNNDIRMSTSTPALIEISRLCYAEMLADDVNVQKTILPEYLDYYSTAMLWFRLVSLKIKLSQPITLQERDLLLLVENSTFSIPEPILTQLHMIGTVQTMTREHLTPTVPDLPTQQVADHGRYFGAITEQTHNSYEELPCLGVLSEAVRRAISNDPPGPYQSSLAADNLEPNQNLLGYRALGNRRNEAKNLAFDAGITQDLFPEYPNNTGININLLFSVSAYLAQNKTFKVTTLNLNTLTESGSVVQMIIQRSEPPIGLHDIEKLGDISNTCLANEQLSVVGAGIMYLPQLWKSSSTPMTARTWRECRLLCGRHSCHRPGRELGGSPGARGRWGGTRRPPHPRPWPAGGP